MADTTKTNQPEQSTDVKKSVETQKSDLDRVVDLVGSLAKTMEDSIKATDSKIANIEASIKAISEKPKAMETPTNLHIKPEVTAEEDIGAKVQAPNNFYQGQSQQAGIDDASPKSPHKTDQADLKMEEKTNKVSKSQNITQTETAPRPSIEVSKGGSSNGVEQNPILKAAREVGFAGIDEIARNIRKGVYHQEAPSWRGNY